MVEIIVGASIISISLLALVGIYNYYLQVTIHNTPNIQAAYLLEEGMEVMRSLRDQSWDSNIQTLTFDGATKYYLVFNTETSKWSTTASVQPLIDGLFERVVTVNSVYRNANHEIVPNGTSGAVLDANTAMITTKVSWSNGSAVTDRTISSYLTDTFGN